MPDPQRVEFVTRHFKDLQTIRFAAIPVAMLLAPLVPSTPPHLSRGLALAVVSALLAFPIGFYWWSTVAIRRRYGSVKESRVEAQRMQNHPIVVAVSLITAAAWLWFRFVALNRDMSTNIFEVFAILMIVLPRIIDSTNPPTRRVVWAIGLAALFGAGPFLILADLGEQANVLAGVVWLSLSIFDFLLLRRTFAEISASPSSEPTEPVAQFG